MDFIKKLREDIFYLKQGITYDLHRNIQRTDENSRRSCRMAEKYLKVL